MKRLPVFLTLALVVGLSSGVLPHAMLEPAEDHVPLFAGRSPGELPILAPCSRHEDRYDSLGYKEATLETWPKTYHERVDKIINEYLAPLDLACDAENYESLLKAGPKLTSLARSLPSWSNPGVVVSRFDTSRVLLENLRIYECAMMEYENFLALDTTEEVSAEEFGDEPAPRFWDFKFSDLTKESGKRLEVIVKERIVARETLHRTLSLVGAYERLKPMEAELGCMQLMSLDARNIAALMAETSSCLPRVWNAKDPLRDYNAT
tara:strand:- start:74 stop:865 length:792 start_codon:yes stop_codon:yes gene_type:complete